MTSIAFVSQLAKKANVGKTYGLTKRVEAVKGCRKVGERASSGTTQCRKSRLILKPMKCVRMENS